MLRPGRHGQLFASHAATEREAEFSHVDAGTNGGGWVWFGCDPPEYLFPDGVGDVEAVGTEIVLTFSFASFWHPVCRWYWGPTVFFSFGQASTT
jgi:hypothetical protein